MVDAELGAFEELMNSIESWPSMIVNVLQSDVAGVETDTVDGIGTWNGHL